MSIVERSLQKARQGRAKPGTGPHSSMIGTVAPAPHLDTAQTGAYVPPTRHILIDRAALREAGYLPEVTEDRAFADQYRQVKRPLIAAALRSAPIGPGSAGLIMMASALPGDGKTFTSINLALSMARERDTSVVLVDADLAKPHVTRIFGAHDELGLLDALTDRSLDIESLILPTDVRGLSVLPAGKPRDGAAELLASERMRQIVTTMQERNPRRLALFDSSPLLATTESLSLSSMVGQIVIVVRAGQTPRQAVQDALQHLGADARVSFVLNQGRPGVTQGSYFYQGNYGDHQAGQD